MATETLDWNITSDGWTQILTAGENLFIQIKTGGPVYVYVGSGDPASVDAPTAGICLTKNGLDHAAIPLVEGGLWLTRQDGETENVVIVGTYTLYSPEPS